MSEQKIYPSGIKGARGESDVAKHMPSLDGVRSWNGKGDLAIQTLVSLVGGAAMTAKAATIGDGVGLVSGLSLLGYGIVGATALVHDHKDKIKRKFLHASKEVPDAAIKRKIKSFEDAMTVQGLDENGKKTYLLVGKDKETGKVSRIELTPKEHRLAAAFFNRQGQR